MHYSVPIRKYFLFNNNFNSPHKRIEDKITIMEITARLTGNAEVKTLKDDRQVVNFNVAINDSYKPKGGDAVTKLVTYVQCAYWVNSNIAQYLTKGTLVELHGRIGVNAYNNLQGEAKLKSLLFGGTGQLRTQKAFNLCEDIAKNGDDGMMLN